MGKELYVGHLSYDTTEYDLEKLFSVSGRVTSIHLITDPATGEFKGCGYVRMSTEAEAKDAIASLDGALLISSKITVSEARPQKQKNQAGGYKGKSGGAPKAGAGGRGAGAKAGSAKEGFGKSAPAKAGGAKPAGFKASGPKPAGAKPAAAKPAGAKPAAAKAGGAKAGGFKAGGSKPGGSGTGGSRSGKR